MALECLELQSLAVSQVVVERRVRSGAEGVEIAHVHVHDVRAQVHAGRSGQCRHLLEQEPVELARLRHRAERAGRAAGQSRHA